MKKLCMLGLMLLLFVSVGKSQTIEEVKSATTNLLSTFDTDQLAVIQIEFEDSSRTKWTNLPVGLAPRTGLRYGEFSTESRIAFHELLTTLLSSQGYLKTTSIMMLDDILNEVYAEAYELGLVNDEEKEMIDNLLWDFENYYIAIWNEPNSETPWGFKLEGHHISLNLTAFGDEFTINPLFVGTDPHVVPLSKYAGLKVLSKEEEYAFELMDLFSEKQLSKVIISEEVPGDIITNPNGPTRLDELQGLKGEEMTQKQRDVLRRVIMEYVNNLEHEKAHEAMAMVEQSELNDVYFGWIGSLQPGAPHYYIINAKDFMIEYDNIGFQNDGNHIHTIWRDKNNDFGQDILKNHYQTHDH